MFLKMAVKLDFRKILPGSLANPVTKILAKIDFVLIAGKPGNKNFEKFRTARRVVNFVGGIY